LIFCKKAGRFKRLRQLGSANSGWFKKANAGVRTLKGASEVWELAQAFTDTQPTKDESLQALALEFAVRSGAAENVPGS
jgi:hypothetical protein